MLLAKKKLISTLIFCYPFISSITSASKAQQKTKKDACVHVQPAGITEDQKALFENILHDHYTKKVSPSLINFLDKKPYIVGYIEIKDFDSAPAASHRFPDPKTLTENLSLDLREFAQTHEFELPQGNVLYGILYSNNKVAWIKQLATNKKPSLSHQAPSNEDLDDNDLYKHGAHAVAGSAAGW